MLQHLLPGVEWRIEIAEIPQGAIAHTSRASALRYVELMRKMVTGARPLSTPPATNDLTLEALPEKDLVEALALELYVNRHETSWVVVPEKFF